MKIAGGKSKCSVARGSGNEQKLRSAGIFQTLFAKCAVRIPTRSLDSRASILVGPLFSHSYELLFTQPLSFHNHPHCPGVWGSLRPLCSDLGALCVKAFPWRSKLSGARVSGNEHRFYRYLSHAIPLALSSLISVST